jgi:hypothetical protein
MPNDNFKPTVDLRQNQQLKPDQKSEPRRQPQPQSAPKLNQNFGERADPSPGKVLPREVLAGTRDEQQKIDRPPAAKVFEQSKDYLKIVFAAIALLTIIAGGYFFWYKPRQAVKNVPQAKWYMVKLTNSETFYGQIKNTSGDPVVIDNVYYDYDQLSSSAKATEDKNNDQTGQIRLVKRGKETHGPSGSLDVVRMQVLYMEPLADDSKVLKAIVEYEKK